MNTKVIDITMFMGDWTYPGDKPFSIGEPYSAFGPDKEFCYNFSTNSAEGTHIQGPHYFLKNGKKINEFPIEYFRREAVLVDLTDINDDTIPTHFLKEQLNGEKMVEKAVIFRTGIMGRLINGEKVKDKLLLDDGARFLIGKGVKMVVTDTTCLDDPIANNGDAPITKLLLENNIVLVKQVCNLSQISKKHVVVEAYPLKIRGISGTPCRAVVLEEI